MANVLCVLYDDPVDGYPPRYARDDIPRINRYYDGQLTPTPKGIDFTPGELLGCVSGELGLRGFLEQRGHRFTVTADKDGPDSVFERELPEAEIVISQPFWPGYLTAQRIASAPNLKLALTAGIGSDHVDLQAAMDRAITVAEVTYCNSISVAEHVVMMILALVRNYIPSHQWVLEDGWNIADCVSRSYDLEGMHVGTVAAGRIGSAVLRRLKPFEVNLHYTDRHRLPDDVERELGVTFHQHGTRQDLRSRRRRPRLRERPARRLRGRRVVPPARAAGPSVALDAPSGDDAAHLRDEPLGAGPLRGGCARDTRMLFRRAPDPRRVPDRRSRHARRDGGALLQRRRRHRGLGRGRAFRDGGTRSAGLALLAQVMRCVRPNGR